MRTVTVPIPKEVEKARSPEEVERAIQILARRIALQILAEELSLTEEEALEIQRNVREGLRRWVKRKVKR